MISGEGIFFILRKALPNSNKNHRKGMDSVGFSGCEHKSTDVEVRSSRKGVANLVVPKITENFQFVFHFVCRWQKSTWHGPPNFLLVDINLHLVDLILSNLILTW